MYSQSEWIHVSDGLPRNVDQKVICWSPELGVRMGKRLGSGKPYIRPEGCHGFDEVTVYWAYIIDPNGNIVED